jgi:hypothetical protein
MLSSSIASDWQTEQARSTVNNIRWRHRVKVQESMLEERNNIVTRMGFQRKI